MNIDHSSIRIDEAQAQVIARQLYGLEGMLSALPGEVDFNFKLIAHESTYLLKISRPAENVAYLEFQNSILNHVAQSENWKTPKVHSDLAGNTISRVLDSGGQTRWVRLLDWVHGRLWSAVNPITDKLRHDLGKHAGLITNALQKYKNTFAHRDLEWNLADAAWTEKHLDLFDDHQRSLVALFQERFSAIQVRYGKLRKSVIHGDINDNNIVVSTDRLNPEVNGIIDFGDANYSQTVNELAITLAYAIMNQPDAIAAAMPVIKGFYEQFPLFPEELECLHTLVGMRLVTSVTKSAINKLKEPDNKYLLISEKPAWKALESWAGVNACLAFCHFSAICGLAPHNTEDYLDWIRSNQTSVKTLFPSLSYDSIHSVDMSISSTWLGHESEFNDLALTEFKIKQLQGANNQSLIAGGYLETRPFYSTDSYGKEGNNGPEYRTVHLGIDFWVAAKTPVHAIADGVAFSVFNNDNEKDYGPTVILAHQINDECEFFTLHGHLSKSTLDILKPGDRVQKGDLIGFVGCPTENGIWASHLHFQIILDMLGNRHDFPGVACPSEIETWKRISPDPAMLFVELEPFQDRAIDSKDLADFRQQHLGRGMSVSYEKPLQIVRGSGIHLMDPSGRKFLDTVNNVAHVGHEHPRVVQAAQRQIAVLNTNTRYLNKAINEFSAKLLSTFPDDLSVVHFVNSGSEANELAIRMAKAITGQMDFVAVEFGYHGNTNACVDVSSYKFDGTGGNGAPNHTHIVPLPDSFRGIYVGEDKGQQYAGHIAEQIDKIQNAGRHLAGFICESIISCGGQIELPEGYLRTAYSTVRNAGGVCIADEVQTGCGRVGRHFWAFQLHDVVPDIVTIGKPIGNGHPLGAVVCTRKIADAFANGMEYFNTFGGNPVSCVVGLEVLRVIKDEGLQQNALEVGSYLKSELEKLRLEFPIVQGIRGQGLFLGFELIDASMAPLPANALRLANRMRELGILMSTDGKDNNVIKLKPPMLFSRSNADQLIFRLRQVLCEDYFNQR